MLKHEKILSKWKQQFRDSGPVKLPSGSPKKLDEKQKLETAKPSTSHDVPADQSETKKLSQSKGKKSASKRTTSKYWNQSASSKNEKKSKQTTKKSDADKTENAESGSRKRQRRSLSQVNYNETKADDEGDEEEEEKEEEEEEDKSKKGKARKGKATKQGNKKYAGIKRKTSESEEEIDLTWVFILSLPMEALNRSLLFI